MPLLCISLLALLLLPLSLSCNSKTPPKDVRDDYMAIVQTDLYNTRGRIATLLQNSSCTQLKHKLPSCISNNADLVSTLHTLTCKMKNLRPSNTDRLVASVLNSIRCPCHGKPTKQPNVSLTRTTATTKKRKDWKHSEIKRLCRVKAILSTMTECYEMLNTVSMDT